MYDISKIKPRHEFKFWYIRQGIGDFFDVYTQSPNYAGGFIITGIGQCGSQMTAKTDIIWEKRVEDVDAIDFEVLKSDFADFYLRPEYVVGIPIPEEVIDNMEINADVCERLLAGCVLAQYSRCRNEEKAFEDIQKFLEWLRETDFYTAPGSTRFHDSEPGGLLKHSLRVANNVCTFLQLPEFTAVEAHEAVLAALLHDICKVGTYEMYMRNVKDESTGVWEKIPSYRYKVSSIPFGHGVTSMYIAMRYFRLTMEQALAIRWHMGAWHITPSESSELSAANENFPMCLLLQFADNASTTGYGKPKNSQNSV